MQGAVTVFCKWYKECELELRTSDTGIICRMSETYLGASAETEIDRGELPHLIALLKSSPVELCDEVVCFGKEQQLQLGYYGIMPEDESFCFKLHSYNLPGGVVEVVVDADGVDTILSFLEKPKGNPPQPTSKENPSFGL